MLGLRSFLFTRPLIEEWGPLGRRVARRSYQRNVLIGLGLAASIELVAWGASTLLFQAKRAGMAGRGGGSGRQLRVMDYRELGLPPSLGDRPAESAKFQVASPKRAVPPAATPVPAPVARAEAATISTQSQIPFVTADLDTGLGSAGRDTGTSDGDGGFGGGGTGGRGGSGGGGGTGTGGSGIIVPPVIVAMSWPDHPPEARKMPRLRIELAVHVTVTGAVDSVRVERKSRCPACERAAVASAWRLRCRPATRDGVPIAAWMRFPVTFDRR